MFAKNAPFSWVLPRRLATADLTTVNRNRWHQHERLITNIIRCFPFIFNPKIQRITKFRHRNHSWQDNTCLVKDMPKWPAVQPRGPTNPQQQIFNLWFFDLKNHMDAGLRHRNQQRFRSCCWTTSIAGSVFNLEWTLGIKIFLWFYISDIAITERKTWVTTYDSHTVLFKTKNVWSSVCDFATRITENKNASRGLYQRHRDGVTWKG